MESIYLTLMMKGGNLFTLTIPKEAEGKYFFTDTMGSADVSFLSLQAMHSQWYLFLDKKSVVKGETGSKLIRLCENSSHVYEILHKETYWILFMEYGGKESRVFHNFFPKRQGEFTIGSASNCDIYFPGGEIAKQAAGLTYSNGSWSIRSLENASCLYVNKRNLHSCSLSTGDVIFLMGLKIIIGAGFISINNGNLRAMINPASFASGKCSPFPATGAGQMTGSGPMSQELPFPTRKKEYFNRLPRVKQPLDPDPIVIENPPLSLSGNSIPLLLRMGGSMVLGGSSLLHGSYASVFSMLLFPILNQKYTDKQKAEYEQKRLVKYRQYLTQKKVEIRLEKNREEKILNETYPATSEILTFPDQGSRLFERRNIEKDFMCLRIGYGDRPILADYQYSKERFNLEEDPLEKEMHQLTDSKAVLHHVPVMLDLKENVVASITGKSYDRMQLLKNLILQTVILHSYDEVKTIFLLDEKTLECMPEIRYLPHTWDDRKSFRFIAVNTAEAGLISEQLMKEMAEPLKRQEDLKSYMKERPFYLVFALSKRLFDSMEVLKKVLKQQYNCGLSVITFFNQAPKEASSLITLRENGVHKMISLKEDSGTACRFQMDAFNREKAEKAMKTLSNTRLNTAEDVYTLPDMISFLELFGVGRVEYLNPVSRWAENNPVKSLAAPIGMAQDGSIFTLDLHEKYQGPHGLVAGSTGSGKSEFIITYILSMAVNYHPDEVAFVLIDYKGGGLAGAFDNPEKGIRLPHIAGTITNLDGAAISRSLSSIQAELKRRQRLFNEAKISQNESTMDIYRYQQLYRNKKVETPMPHLFIVSDEFAELKTQEPEFMDALISAARIGRSLGIHLILATQKPSGVVNDQIISNSKFRVCLKVQTRSDSEEMLGQPDAAELVETGRFFLKVGYNESFSMGQSAWCGCPYEPLDQVIENRDESIQIIDTLGQNTVTVKPTRKGTDSGTSQLTAIVRYLSDLAAKMQIPERKLWLEPLPSELGKNFIDHIIDNARDSYGNNSSQCPCLGMVDDPENQTQFPLTFDLMDARHVLVAGESRGGKTTFLETLLHSHCRKYSPDEFNFYALDFSGGQLRVFDSLPHCGGVYTENDENSIEKFFRLLQDLIDERKNIFKSADVNGFEAYRQIASMPLIAVVMDQASNLKNWLRGEEKYMELPRYMKEGSSCGIRFVLSVNRMNDLLVKIQHKISHGFGIQAKDRFDYQDITGGKTNIIPQNTPGRGICKIGERTLEFQTARFNCETKATEQERLRALRKEVKTLSLLYGNCKSARRLPVLSYDQEYKDFISDIPAGRIPIGYALSEIRKISMPLKQLTSLSIYMGNSSARQIYYSNLIRAFAMNGMDLILVEAAKDSVFRTAMLEDQLFRYPGSLKFLKSSEGDSIRLWQMLAEIVKERKEAASGEAERDENESGQVGTKGPVHKPLMVLFERYLDYCAEGDESCNTIMPQIYAKGKQYNIFFSACFYPDDDFKIATDPTFKAFNQDKFTILLGGQLDKQSLVHLPAEYRELTNVSEKPGSTLMYYREKLHPLYMPCGAVIKKVIDPDDLPII